MWSCRSQWLPRPSSGLGLSINPMMSDRHSGFWVPTLRDCTPAVPPFSPFCGACHERAGAASPQAQELLWFPKHNQGLEKLWGCCSHDLPWLWPYPSCSIPLAGTKPWAAGLLLDRQEQNQGCRGRMSPREVALGSSRNPPCPWGGPWQVLGGGARFPCCGGCGSEQVWELGAVLPPPSSIHCPDSNMLYGS